MLQFFVLNFSVSVPFSLHIRQTIAGFLTFLCHVSTGHKHAIDVFIVELRIADFFCLLQIFYVWYTK